MVCMGGGRSGCAGSARAGRVSRKTGFTSSQHEKTGGSQPLNTQFTKPALSCHLLAPSNTSFNSFIPKQDQHVVAVRTYEVPCQQSFRKVRRTTTPHHHDPTPSRNKGTSPQTVRRQRSPLPKNQNVRTRRTLLVRCM